MKKTRLLVLMTVVLALTLVSVSSAMAGSCTTVVGTVDQSGVIYCSGGDADKGGVHTYEWKQSADSCIRVIHHYNKDYPGMTATTEVSVGGHTYGDLTVVKEGNCLGPKVSQQTCTRCGYVRTVEDDSYLTQHDYSAWTQVQAPTCVQPGVEISVCKWCGKLSPSNKTRQIAPTGVHIKDTTLVVKVAPSCVAGSGYYACKYGCGTIMEDNVYIAPVAGHPVIQYRVATPETCTTDGVGESYCTTCGTVVKREKIPAKHVEKKVYTNEANCCVAGHYNIVCSRCGEVIKEGLSEAPTGEHELQGRLVAGATCITAEKWEQYCPNTGKVYASYSGAPALGHSGVQDITKKAGCCTEGTYNVVCSRCNMVLETGLKTSATGNHDVKQREVSPATCTKAQVLEEYCNTSGKVLGTVTGKPATGHAYEKVVGKAATCTEDGYYNLKCKNCGDVQTKVETIGKLGHDMKEKVTQQPTCTAEGKLQHYCARTGCTYWFESPIAATGHNLVLDHKVEAKCDNVSEEHMKCTNQGCTHTEVWYGKYAPGHEYDKVVGKAATCTEDGYYNLKCKNCGLVKEKAETIGKLGHDMKDNTVAATCTEDGFTGKKCSVCGYKEGTTISKLGHDMKQKTILAPTCQQDGKEQYYCNREGCTYSYEERIDGKDAHYGVMTIKTKATCTQEGATSVECRYCGKHLADGTIPATGHTMEAYTVAATCTEDGFTGKKCSVCDYKEGTVVKAKGHTYGEWQVEREPTTTEKGMEVRYCTVCGADDYRYIPVATATPTAIATATAAPTATATATAAPTATATAKPTATATAKPTATATAAPTATATAEPTATATAAPTATATAEPTATATAKPAATATAAPTATATAAPTKNPGEGDGQHQHKEMVIEGYPAGCETPGMTDTVFCPECGEIISKGEVIPPKGHNIVIDPAVPPTETTMGKTEGSHCEDCGKVFKPQYDVDKIGGGNGDSTGDNGGGNGGDNGGNTGDNDNGNGGSGLPNYKDGDIVDDNGNVIGRVEDDEKVFDNDGNQVGTIDGDGNIVDDTGNVVGKVDEDGNVYDEDGEHAGIIIGGIDLPGKEYKDGDIVDDDGNVIGRVDGDVVTDNDGNFVGIIDKDGNIVDGNGNVVGKVDEDANVYDENGNHVGIIIGGIDLPGSGAYMPGHPDFDLDKYLDEYYKHVEGGDVIRPGIDSDKCIIGQEITPDGSSKPVIVKGAEDYAICPVCKYPMSQWISLGNGQHIRYCTDKDCDYYEIADCPYFYITVDEVEYHVCPICGDFTERLYEFIDGVMVGGAGEMHSLYVRGLDKPFAEAAHVVKNYQDEAVVIRYSFTAVQSEKGVLNHWDKMLSVFIPVENAEGLKLVRMDREGNFEQITYMYFNGNLAFNTDCEGLYLLLSAE